MPESPRCALDSIPTIMYIHMYRKKTCKLEFKTKKKSFQKNFMQPNLKLFLSHISLVSMRKLFEKISIIFEIFRENEKIIGDSKIYFKQL